MPVLTCGRLRAASVSDRAVHLVAFSRGTSAVTGTVTLDRLDHDSYSSIVFRADVAGHEDHTVQRASAMFNVRDIEGRGGC